MNKPLEHPMYSLFSFQLTFSSVKHSKSMETLAKRNSFDSAHSYGHQMFTKVVLYHGQTLAMKVICKQYIAITPEVIKEINEVSMLNLF